MLNESFREKKIIVEREMLRKFLLRNCVFNALKL